MGNVGMSITALSVVLVDDEVGMLLCVAVTPLKMTCVLTSAKRKKRVMIQKVRSQSISAGSWTTRATR